MPVWAVGEPSCADLCCVESFGKYLNLVQAVLGHLGGNEIGCPMCIRGLAARSACRHRDEVEEGSRSQDPFRLPCLK